MDHFYFISSVSLALGLSAACGFRVFIPPLAYGIFYKAELVDLHSSWSWIGNDWVIGVFAIAAIIEIFATFIPWLDNFLDIIATPAAILAGIILSSSCLESINPGLQWMLSVICGVVVAGGLQLSTVTLRGLSSIFTGGIANPLVALSEDALAIGISVMVIMFPILGVLIVLLIFFLIRSLIKRLRRKKRIQTIDK